MRILLPYLIRWGSLNKSRYEQLLSRLAQMGHEIVVLQPAPFGTKDTGFIELEKKHYGNIVIEDVKPFPIIWNRTFPFNKAFKKTLFMKYINSHIDDIVKKYEIDVILFYNFLLDKVVKLDNVITIYDLGDDHIDLLKKELKGLAFPFIVNYFSKKFNKILNESSLVLTVSHILREKYHQNAVLLPNGVDEIDIDEIAPISDLYDKPRPIIGFIGSLEYFIDFELILQVAKSCPNYTFVIAGGGREYDRIKIRADELNLKNIILTGGLPHAEILRYIKSFDICLNTFKKLTLSHAACPIKLFEYMAFKKPIISTRISEVQKIDSGFLYFADSVEETIAQIQQIVQSPKEAVKRGEKGYELIQSEYNWNVLAEKLNFLIQQVHTPEEQMI